MHGSSARFARIRKCGRCDREGMPMAMKINGITGTLPVANVNKRTYKYTSFSMTMSATVDGVLKTVDVKTVLEKAWGGGREAVGVAGLEELVEGPGRGEVGR